LFLTSLPVPVFLKRFAAALFVFSFNPTKAFVDYTFPIYAGKYTYVLNTDNPAFGGQGLINEQTEHFTQYINHQNLISLYIPPRIGLVLKRG